MEFINLQIAHDDSSNTTFCGGVASLFCGHAAYFIGCGKCPEFTEPCPVKPPCNIFGDPGCPVIDGPIY